MKSCDDEHGIVLDMADMSEYKGIAALEEDQLAFTMSGRAGIFLILCMLSILQASTSSVQAEHDGSALAVTGDLSFARKLYQQKKKTKPKKKKPKKSYYVSRLSFTGNVIDDCWVNGDWRNNRKHLADCAVGYGADATGGQGGNFYQVTDGGDDPVNPLPGTLRYGVTRLSPLWITFQRDMNIKLKAELLIASYKTIDARGANVQIGFDGPCLTLQYVNHVIIHGLNLHDCKPGSGGRVITSAAHTGYRDGSDGDAISIFTSTNIWIDHCSLSRAADGLIDAIRGSTAITVSNNYFSDHDKVMLFGHSDSYSSDKNMQVTVVYNHFAGCVQRMPRGRFGYFHVVNNNYENWDMYAIGGSANPTFLSEGNRFVATSAKQVTKREAKGGGNWLWQSSGDLFINGAYFVESGKGDASPHYNGNQYFTARPASMVSQVTTNAGPLLL